MEKGIIVLAVMLVMNILFWLFLMPRIVNRKITEFQNDLVNKYYDEVEIMYRKMRGWRHDYHNHIQVLKANICLEQYEQAEEYLDKLEADLTTVDTVLKTGNVMVDAILNSKLSLLQEKKIAVDATAIVPENINISGIDLSVLIGNLLDNAMEACEKQADEAERFIRVFIGVLKKQLYISVTNSVGGDVQKVGKRYVSTKKTDNHGFGLMRIDSIAERCGGYVNRQSEPGVFATEVMLPL